MSAAFKLTENKNTIKEEARTHIEILTELLRDVNLEKRMETLIKAEGFLKQKESYGDELELIKKDLEEDLMKVRKMIFMVEQAQYFTQLT